MIRPTSILRQMHMLWTKHVLAFTLVTVALNGCAPSHTALNSLAPFPSLSASEVPTQTPDPSPIPTEGGVSPGGLLIPPYVYDDGTFAIDGPIAIEGVVFEIDSPNLFQLCITRDYACADFDDIIPIRLAEIDLPKPNRECYGDEAALELAELLLEGAPVSIITDPNLPKKDKHGFLQAWVWNSEVLVNLELVKRGAAAPVLTNGKRSAFAQRLVRAAGKAKAAGRGMWEACNP
jgi:endonuclease YncB( thermonuclease family)